MRVRAFVIFLVAALGGCSTYRAAQVGMPEVVFQSSVEPGLKIVRQTTAYAYDVVTPEGMRVVNRKFDHHYSLTRPDGTTTALPFLDVRQDPVETKGVISAVFNVGGKDTWVALSERFGTRILGYTFERGWTDNGRAPKDLTARVFVKTFGRTALLHDAELDVCNPSNAANPPVLFDEANAVLRYCNREGIQLYFPLTGMKKLERSALCCHDSSQGGSRRDWKDFYQRTAG